MTPKFPFATQQSTILRIQSTALSDIKAANELSSVEGIFWPLCGAEIYSDITRVINHLVDPPADVNNEPALEVIATQSSEEPLVLKEPVILQEPTLPLGQAPDNRPGIDASSPWFLNIQQVRPFMCCDVCTIVFKSL